MGLFGKKPTFLGVDFGSDLIKVAAVSVRDGRPYLSDYAYAHCDNPSRRSDVLRMIVSKLSKKSRNAYVALPGSSGLITVITFPKMSSAELEQAVRFEARKYIPMPLEEVNIAHDIILPAASSGKNAPAAGTPSEVSANRPEARETIDVLLVAAPRKDVQAYEKLIVDARLNIKALELETFALVRSLIGDDRGAHVIVDIGHTASNIVAVDGGVIRANRNIGIGGAHIITAISQALGVEADRARTYLQERDDLLQENGLAVQNIDMIVSDIRVVLRSFSSLENVTLLVSGGVSGLHMLTQYLQRRLGVTTVIGNPFARLTVPAAAQQAVTKLRGSYAVAVGLALRGVSEYHQ